MSSSSERPHRGISLDEAFAKWSDRAKYAVLLEIAGKPDLPSLSQSHNIVFRDRQREYEKVRTKLEEAFIELMMEGDIRCSAIARGASGRGVIESSLWEVIELDFTLDEVCSPYAIFQKPEFFEKSAIPSNVISEEPPSPLALGGEISVGRDIFEPDTTYRHIYIGRTFVLGPLCAEVIRILDEAAKTHRPWISGKVLLEQAGSVQSNMHDVFKSVGGWQALIESDGRGQYRLRPRGNL